MKHKLLRGLVAVALVCVLLVSWSPIRAQASVLGGTALLLGDDAIAIILAVLGGLGVFAVADSHTSDLEARALARSAMDAMEEAGTFVKNGALTVYTNVSETWSYAVSTGLVQWLHDWLFSSGTLDSPVFHTSLSAVLKSGKVSTFTCSEPFTMGYFYCTKYNDYYAFAFTAQKAVISYGSTSLSTHISHPNGYYSWTYADESCTLPYYGTTNLTYHDFIGSLNLSAGTVTTQQELTLGTVAPPGTDIETEYGEYIVIVAPNGVPDTGGDGGDDEQPKIPVLPVPYLPPNEIPNVPQEDIWNGNKVEIENPDSGDTSDSIAEAVGNVIKSIFVPDADFISEKWNAIRSRFDFADSISSSGEMILDVLNGIDPEPPVIYVDLGDAEGSYYLGGQVAFLDLRWYERYKPTGDAIISAFLWLVFVWRMFIKLPGIIGGLPGDFVMQGVVNLGLSEHLPSRKKEYEYERQQNRRSMKK